MSLKKKVLPPPSITQSELVALAERIPERPTPIINELALIRALNPDVPITPDGLRAVSCLCVHACFDRRVERKFFVEVVDAMADVFTLMRDLENGIVIDGKMQPATPQVVQHIKALRIGLGHRMELVQQCPTAEDKVS